MTRPETLKKLHAITVNLEAIKAAIMETKSLMGEISEYNHDNMKWHGEAPYINAIRELSKAKEQAEAEIKYMNDSF